MNSELIMGLVIGLIVGLILGWLLFRGKKQDGDLSIEGEGALKAEADKLRAENQELKGRVSKSETTVADLQSKLSGSEGAAPVAVSSDDDETYALEWRNRYLAARVKYLEGRLSDAPASKTKAAPKKRATAKTSGTAASLAATTKPAAKKTATKKPAAKKPAAKPAAKKAAPKKAAPKKVAAKKPAAKAASASTTKRKPGPKPGTKRGALTAAGTPRKKPGPKPGTASKAKPKVSAAEAAFEKYYTNVKKYDANAKRQTVENIVKYCGVALQSRDSSLVACSDETELKTVANGFVTKKLGKDSGQMELVKEVCQEMKGERFKNRVTFYYLAAKKARKMSLFN